MIMQILLTFDVIGIFIFSLVLLIGGIYVSIRAIKNWTDEHYQVDILLGVLFIFLSIAFVVMNLKIISIYF